jgi:putative FmdB family regulatory protein
MPIYEYQCAKCGKTIEVIQKFSDKPLKKHQECGGNLTKLISAAGFQFKGSGWYVTDYARKGQSEKSEGAESSKKDSKETPSNEKKDGNADKSADTKPEKKGGTAKSGGSKD